MNKYAEYIKEKQTIICLETENLSRLLSLLSDPQKGMDFIHVTGTNGKGSVCAFLEKAAAEDGFRVGRFSSPELIEKTECIRVNGENIKEELFDAAAEEVGAAADRLEEKPSPFEALFAAALLIFKREGCAPVIVEVGMGGEGDATNIIENTKIEIITKISPDHTKYLGKTAKEIAGKKAAIIKRDSTAVSAIQEKEAEEVIRRECELKNAELFICPPFESLGFEEIYEKISYGGEELKLSMGGLVQLENASLAAKAASLYGISEKSVKAALSSAKNPARLENLRENLYFDGAHNPDGAKALSESLERYFGEKPKKIVMGVMADKDYRKMLGFLNRGQTFFCFVPVRDNPRSETPGRLLEAAKELGIKNARAADLKTALADAGNKSPTIVCGSLYLYKSFLEELWQI